jgi:hypothetical protein
MPNRPLVYPKVAMLVKAITSEGKTATNIFNRMKLSGKWGAFREAVAYSMTLAVNQHITKKDGQDPVDAFIAYGRKVPEITDNIKLFPILAVREEQKHLWILEAGHHRAEAMAQVIRNFVSKHKGDLDETYIEKWSSQDAMMNEVSLAMVSISAIPDNSETSAYTCHSLFYLGRRSLFKILWPFTTCLDCMRRATTPGPCKF